MITDTGRLVWGPCTAMQTQVSEVDGAAALHLTTRVQSRQGAQDDFGQPFVHFKLQHEISHKLNEVNADRNVRRGVRPQKEKKKTCFFLEKLNFEF